MLEVQCSPLWPSMLLDTLICAAGRQPAAAAVSQYVGQDGQPGKRRPAQRAAKPGVLPPGHSGDGRGGAHAAGAGLGR